MKLLTMTTNQCVLYSAAMVLDSAPETLIHEIGHDGMVVTWPELRAPQCYNGFHPQEIIDCAWRRGYAMMVIETESFSGPENSNPIRITPKDTNRLQAYMALPGIIIGTNICGHGHAVAWDGKKVYDPNGLIYPLNEFKIYEFWAFVRAA